MSDALVQVRDVHKVYARGTERIDVLKGLDLEVPQVLGRARHQCGVRSLLVADPRDVRLKTRGPLLTIEIGRKHTSELQSR